MGRSVAKKNSYVSDALLLEKYKGLICLDLDTKVNFNVHEDNLEFHREVDGI